MSQQGAHSERIALSIVIVFYNMRREAERTLFSLSPTYQHGVSPEQYEVIAIENGSSEPILDTDLTRFGPNFRYHYRQTDEVSPVRAINAGIALAAGKHVAVIVDGARMASPGLISQTLEAAKRFPSALLGTLAWHLGPEDQRFSIPKGYSAEVEDAALQEANWRDDGYALFSIAALCPSSGYGIKGGMPPELSYLVAARDTLTKIGGYDERFQTLGGGFMNFDIVERLLEATSERPVLLAGEGTFHQIHGGVTTNASEDARPHDDFRAEYRRIKGRDFEEPEKALPRYFGPIPKQAERFVASKPRQYRRIGAALTAHIAPGPLAAFRNARDARRKSG